MNAAITFPENTAGTKTAGSGVVKKPHVWGLFKNVQMQGAQKTEPRGVYRYTLSGAVCSATQQMSVFQQPRSLKKFQAMKLIRRFEHFIEESNWDERLMGYEKYIDRFSRGIIIVSAVFFIPVFISIFSR